MKSRAWAAGLASCCLLSTLSMAQAAEVTLSEAALDRVTAGALLFDVDNQAFGAVSNQLTPGTLLGPPLPPSPPPPPAPITPPSNAVIVNDGGATATIFLPSSTGSGSLEVILGASSGDGFAAAEAGFQGNVTGGANSRFTSGGSRTNISNFFD